MRSFFPKDARQKPSGARGDSSRQIVESYTENAYHVPLEGSVAKLANSSDLSSTIRSFFHETADERGRRGIIIGCRHQPASDSGTSFKFARYRRVMRVLPDCPGTNVLRAKFRSSRDIEIIEDWVGSILEEDERSSCFGRTAISRAKKSLNVTQVNTESLSTHGELRLVDGWLIAFINKDQSWQRETFTVAHELGHAAIYALSPQVDQSAIGTERLCNMFAAELVMPTVLVHDVWQRMPDVEAIVELSNRTTCSLPVACIRLTEYLGGAVTGIVSEDGVIKERHGPNLGRDLRPSVSWAARKALMGKFSADLPNGLTLSVKYVRKGETAFLVRRLE